jgi:hypothetical protein
VIVSILLDTLDLESKHVGCLELRLVDDVVCKLAIDEDLSID